MQLASRRKLRAHDVGDHTHTLFFVEDRFPSGHFAKTVGDTVIHKVRLVAGWFEFGGFAGVSAVTVAVATLTVPNLFARFNVGGVLHHDRRESGHRFVGRGGGFF